MSYQISALTLHARRHIANNIGCSERAQESRIITLSCYRSRRYEPKRSIMNLRVGFSILRYSMPHTHSDFRLAECTTFGNNIALEGYPQSTLLVH